MHHQSGPFPTRIWLPPFSEPVGIDAPFVMSREVNMIGMAIAKGLEEHGQVGATHMGTAFDAWYPGYIDYAPKFKNIAAFWTETALLPVRDAARIHASTTFPQNMRDLRPQSLYSSPWPPGWWRLRDAVDYMETASLSVLEFASKYKESLLLDRYKAGRDQIARGKKKAPYRVRRPAGAARSGRGGGAAAAARVRRRARIAADRRRSTIGRRHVSGRHVGRADRSGIRGDGARSARRAEAIPICVSIPADRRNGRTTPRAGRCRSQMGVTVVAADDAADGDELRAKMKLLGPDAGAEDRADAVRCVAATDAAAVRQRAGRRLRHRAAAPPRSCRRPGKITGAGAVACRSIRRRTTRSARSIARGRSGATVQVAPDDGR